MTTLCTWAKGALDNCPQVPVIPKVGLTSTFSGWSGRRDSNPRPQRPERCALTKLRYFPVRESLVDRNHHWPGGEAGIVPGATGQQGGDRASQPYGVERLDQPTVGIGAAGHEHVGPAVQDQ